MTPPFIAGLDQHGSRPGIAGEEGRRKIEDLNERGVQSGLDVHAEFDDVEKKLQIDLVLGVSPPGVPQAMKGLPFLSARVGVRVVRGRLPGSILSGAGCIKEEALAPGAPARSPDLRQSATWGNQPPLGVADKYVACGVGRARAGGPRRVGTEGDCGRDGGVLRMAGLKGVRGCRGGAPARGRSGRSTRGARRRIPSREVPVGARLRSRGRRNTIRGRA